MYQTEDSVCISIDKDLLQIPGAHFGMVSYQHDFIEEWDGLVWFYRQILMGDNTDNIKGIHGIGAARSRSILAGCETEEELWECVVQAYENKDLDLAIPKTNGQLMWCHRTPVNYDTLEGIWLPPPERNNNNNASN